MEPTDRAGAGPATAEANLSFEALEERYFLNGAWQELVALYERRLQAPALRSQAAPRARLLFRLAQVLEERVGDVERALECYHEVARLQPGFRPAFAQLRRLYAARGSADLALQVAEHEDDLPMRAPERAVFHSEVAELWSGPMGDPAEALEHLDRALACEPGFEPALRGRAAALVSLDRPEEAADTYARLIETTRGPARAATGVALARLEEEVLGRDASAFESFRRALTDDPTSREALDGVARLAARLGQWPLLAELQERRFELADSADTLKVVALEAAQLEHERLRRPERAAVWYRRVLELDATQHAALLGLVATSGDPNERLQALERALAADGGEVPIAALLAGARDAGAQGAWQRALTLARCAHQRAPEELEVLELLGDALRALEQHGELAQVIERQAALAGSDPRRAAALLDELARLHERELDDDDAALEAWRRAFALDPTRPELSERIERRLGKTGDVEALRAHLERAVTKLPEADRARAHSALGDLLAEAYADPEGAVRCYETALQLTPGCETALRGLERLAKAAGDTAVLVRAYEREAAVTSDPDRLGYLVGQLVALLERDDQVEEALMWAERLLGVSPESAWALDTCARLHARRGEKAEQIAALERLEALQLGAERAATQRRLARTLAASGRDDDAIRWGQAALLSDPGHLETLETLVAPLERTGRFRELADVYRQLAAHPGSEQRLAWLEALATLLGEGLGTPDDAVAVWRELADDPEAPSHAEERLEGVLEERGRFEDLLARLEARQRRTGDAGERARLELRRAGLLLEKLGRADHAAQLYRNALERDPACTEADLGLERSLRIEGDLEGVVLLLGRRASRADADARARIELECAEILDGALGDSTRAQERYTALIREGVDPEVRTLACRRLEALLERTGEWRALYDLLASELAREGSTDADRHERLAGIAVERLDDAEAAVRHLEAASELAPERGDLWCRLGALHESLGRSADLLRAHERELETGPPRDRELVLRARAGSLRVKESGSEDLAEAHYARVLELCPHHAEAAEFLTERLTGQGRIPELAGLLERRIEAVDEQEPGSTLALSLRLRLAELLRDSLDDPEGAVAALEPALRGAGSLPMVAEPLAQLYRVTGRAEALVDLSRAMVDACEVPAERASWSACLGEGLASAGRDAEAIRAFHQALADRPGDREVTSALCNLYRRTGEAEPLARLLESELVQRVGSEEIELRLELAELMSGPLDRATDALLQLRRVLELDPAHDAALESALDLAERLERHDELLVLLDTRLRQRTTGAERGRLLVRRARLLAGPLDRAEAAVEAYRRALHAQPRERAVLRELDAVLERLGRHAERLDLVHAELQAAAPDKRTALLERGAALAAEHLSLDASLPWLERLRAERRDDAGLLSRIAAVHRVAGRHPALLRVLEDELALAPTPERARDLQLERARILEERFGLPLAAARALEATLAAAGDDVAVGHQLASLYERAGQARERARVLAWLVTRVEPGQRNELRCELARLYREDLGEPGTACRWLEQALAHPDEGGISRAELLRDLGVVLLHAGRAREAARVAEQELELLDARDPMLSERRVDLRRTLAALYADELADRGRELVHLRALVDGEDGAAPTAPADVIEAAEQSLIERLRGERGLVELALRLRRRLERRPEDASGWLELAHLEDEQLHRPAAAAEAFEAVLARRPEQLAAWRGLRGACERLGDWEGVARALDGELAHDVALDAEPRAALLRRLGEVAWRRLGSTTRASHAFAAALEARPGDLGALRALEQLLEAMEDWRGALDLYESEIETLGDEDPARRQQVWLRVGRIAMERSSDADRALRAFEAAAALGALEPAQRLAHAEAARAAGDLEGSTRLFAAWCDDPDSEATASDQLLLARDLEQLGDVRAALARAERAIELEVDRLEAWELAARLRGALGDPAGRADALVRASELLPGPEASHHLQEAARSLGNADPTRVLDLLGRAVQRDPAAPTAQAALALHAGAAGESAIAEEAAQAALDLGGEALDAALRARVALEGARAARRLGHLESAVQLFQQVTSLEPDSPDALEGLSQILLQFGSYAEARPLLERRLSLTRGAERADDLARLGDCLEREGEATAALARFREALAIDPDFLEAHEGCVRVLETLGRPRELADALCAQAEAWRENSREAAFSLTRAVQCLLEAGLEPQRAETLLKRATGLDAELGSAWVALARLQDGEGRAQDLLATLSGALAAVNDAPLRAELASMQGRSLQAAGDSAGAARAFRDAVDADPHRVDDAMASSRLFRSLGEWRAATEILEASGVQVRTEDPTRAAALFHELGRLRAGPLEDLEGGLRAYEQALDCDPGCLDAESALADLLVHLPDRRAECLERHRRLLARNPHRTASLRAILRLGAAGEEQKARGLALLAALGCATPEEREGARSAPTLPGGETLDDPLFERVRAMACAAAREISQALETSAPAIETRIDDPVARFRTRTLACAGELSAPALLPLPTSELRTVLCVVADLGAETESVEGNGHLVNALAAALGRRARRRVRRALEPSSPEEVAGIDFGRWRAELQALAASGVLARKGGELRTALLALLDDTGGRPPESADLSHLVESSAAAGALYRRMVRAWVDRLDAP